MATKRKQVPTPALQGASKHRRAGQQGPKEDAAAADNTHSLHAADSSFEDPPQDKMFLDMPALEDRYYNSDSDSDDDFSAETLESCSKKNLH